MTTPSRPTPTWTTACAAAPDAIRTFPTVVAAALAGHHDEHHEEHR